MQITDEDHESQVTLDDGETYFEARLRHDGVHRHVDAAGAVRYSFEHKPGAVHFELISQRYERGSTLITSNLHGDSYRLNQSRSRAAMTPNPPPRPPCTRRSFTPPIGRLLLRR